MIDVIAGRKETHGVATHKPEIMHNTFLKQVVDDDDDDDTREDWRERERKQESMV